MPNQSRQIDQLAQQHVAELHDAARREQLAARTARLSRARGRRSRIVSVLVAHRTRTEKRATNRVTKLAGR
jgi:hypothetical protein